MVENTIMTNEIWQEFNRELLGFIKKRVQDEEKAKDLLQDVFLKIQLKIDSLKDESKTAAWVYQITRNAIIDYYRKQGKPSKELLEVALPEDVNDANLGFVQCLNSFVVQLPEKYRDVMQKVAYGQLSQKEYAEQTGLSYTAAKSRMQRARQKVKEMFVECCAVEADKYGNIQSSDCDDCNDC